jgi:putative ABC transport system ATP-binding protein
MSLAFADVDVAQGSSLLLRGPSGSGKSTWLALAAGLLSPASGQMVVAGQSTGELSGVRRDAWRARHIGFLPQKLHLSAALNVTDNLALVYFALGVKRDDQAIERTLVALGVQDLAHRLPRQLSGGQAQRVALARALLLQPAVILVDEPTASLDDAAARATVDLLQASARRCQATLVIATHDQRVQQALPEAKILLATAWEQAA